MSYRPHSYSAPEINNLGLFVN